MVHLMKYSPQPSRGRGVRRGHPLVVLVVLAKLPVRARSGVRTRARGHSSKEMGEIKAKQHGGLRVELPIHV